MTEKGSAEKKDNNISTLNSELSTLISVVIPVYNVEKYLEECVNSVFSQTCGDYEIILVDDGATDRSGELCDAFARKDSRVSVIHKENGGLSSARNAGAAEATGKYIYFLDSDDRILPDTLETLLRQAERENADIVYFDARSFIDGDETKECSQSYIRKGTYKTGEGAKVLEELQKNREYHSAVPLLFIKKSFYDANGLSFVPVLYEDMIFTYEAFCLAGTAAQCPQPFYQRRYREGSIVMTAKTVRNFESAETVFEEVRDFSAARGILGTEAAKTYIVRCAMNVFNVYRDLNDADKRACKNKYEDFKRAVISAGAFGDPSLKMRCKGYALWGAYKVLDKTVGKVLK